MKTVASATASWVVIPPFHHDAIWRSLVIKAAEAVGRQVYDLDAAPKTAPVNDPRAVILTTDASQPIQAGAPAEAIAGLMTGPGIRLDPHEDPNALPQHIIALTDLVGRIRLLPPERIFRLQNFAAGPVEILKGVMLSPPERLPELPLSERLKAVTAATTLLDPARPYATWTPPLFNSVSHLVTNGSPGELDLTGRPRYLCSGPYIVLPAGRWQAKYRLTFDEPGCRHRFRVDWGGVEDYAVEEFVPGRAGVFEITQEYTWVQPSPAELRIILMQGVFDGHMTFSGAEISRVN